MRPVSAAALLAGSVLLLAACGGREESSEPSDTAPAAAPAAGASSGPSDEEAREILASLPAPYNGADLVNGKRQFAKCRSCHTLPEGAANMTGPNLWGVFGRKAGSQPGYVYSDALKSAGFTWDAETLDRWLQDPKGFLPGNKMSFLGVKAEKDRVDLIGWLKTQTGYEAETQEAD